MPKIIIQFQGQEWSVELKEGSNTIGRASSCTIPVRDTNMSREHCEIQLTGAVATVFDKGSMNGTLLNGAKVLERKLVPGDRIQIGASVIWFQEKKGGAPAPTGSHAAPRSAADDEPTKPTTQRRTEGKVRVAALLKDYTVAGRESGVPVGVIVGVLSVVAIIGIGIVAARVLRGGGAEESDPDNLVSNAGFEQTGLEQIGWGLRTGRTSKLSIENTAAHKGRQSLLLEKSGDPVSLVEDVLIAECFGLGGHRRATISAWVKSDGFTGSVAVKVQWRTAAKGPIVLEELSDPVARSDAWTQVKHEFSAPPAAGAFEAAVCAIGRSGRLFIDDVRVTTSAGETRKPVTLGNFDVDVAPSGAFQVSLQGRTVLSSVMFALASKKEGAILQSLASVTKVDASENQIRIEGTVLTPFDLTRSPFVQQILPLEEGRVLGVSFTFPAAATKQLDAVELVALLPAATQSVTVPAKAGELVERVTVRVAGIDVRLEYGDVIPVTLRRAEDTQTVVQAFPVQPGGGDMKVLLQIRPGGGASAGAADDPVKAANEEISKRQDYARAVAILRQHAGNLKDVEKRGRALARLEELEAQERRDWTETQAAHFRAWISRRAELFDAARQRVTTYDRQWEGDEYQKKSRPLRDELEKLAAEAAGERDLERAKRLLERAKAYAQAGKRALAREVCELLLTPQYSGTEPAREAAEILKSLE